MRNTTILYLLLICITFLFNYSSHAQQPWQIEHAQLNSDYLKIENSSPNPTSFDNMIGTSGGKEIGNFFNNGFHAEGIINNFRSFHLMEADFGDAYFPSDQALPIIDCDCGGALYSCGESQKCPEENTGQNNYGFRGYKATYCDWVNYERFNIREIYAAIECQIPIKPTYCKDYNEFGECISRSTNPCLIKDGRENLNGRKFPDKWYTLEEWGGIDQIQQHAYNYVYSFAGTFCPKDPSKNCVVKVLELGNEPWGNHTPGKLGYHAILKGAVEALKDYYGTDKKDWRMRLSTAAFDARFACHNAPMQYVHEMIPNDPEIKHYLDYLNVHNYPFIKTPCGVPIDEFTLSYTPESPNGGFLALKNMDEWRRLNGMKHARINSTEFGWNSDQEECNSGIGQANQAAYHMRASLLAARFGLHKVFSYLLKDQPKYIFNGNEYSPESPLYCSTGLIDRNGNKKPAFYATETLVKKLAGKHFLKAIEENYTADGKVFAFILGDYDATTKEGKPTHLVAWRSSDLGISNNENIQYPKRDSNKGLPLTTITLPSSTMQISAQDTFFYLGWENGHPQIIGEDIVTLDGDKNHQVKVDLSGLPIVIPIRANECNYNSEGILENCATHTPESPESTGAIVECGTIDIHYGNNWIRLIGQEGITYPKIELINVTNWQYNVVEKCENNCAPSQTFSNLPEGNYLVKVFNPNWTLACNLSFEKRIHLNGEIPTEPPNLCAAFGGDEDEDGICAIEDCNDKDPNYPKTPGTPCNDGNPQTDKDTIADDGCTCKGETIANPNNDNSTNQLPTITCGEVNISYGKGQIILQSITGKIYPLKIQLKQSPYTPYSCHNCGTTKVFDNLTNGTYEIWVNYVSCGLIDLEDIHLSEPCEDSDNDGICDLEDCSPEDNTLPLPINTPCDDENEQTDNDVIQSDGCTCLGEPIEDNRPNTAISCGEINIKYGNGTIEMEGSPEKVYSFTIHDKNNSWKEVFSCWSNCGYLQKKENLSPSNYIVKVYHDGNNSCTTTINLTNNLTPNALSRNVFELSTNVWQQAIQLEWLAGGIAETKSFTIEKSMDGTNFKPIQAITEVQDDYIKTEDAYPDYGTNFYRIKQEFWNGAYRYSAISKEEYFIDNESITLYPNPAKEQLFLNVGHFTNLKGNVTIFNRLGLEVLSKPLDSMQQQLRFDIAQLQNGMYFLIIEAENRKPITRQFIIENGQ